ncbi:MAG: PrsW family glutamic-type intramembrane protease [Thermoplasmata archaeon]
MSIPYKWIIILGVAFIPSIVYSIYIRNIERWEREPWRWVALGYLWGGVAAGIFLAISFFVYRRVEREHEYYRLYKSLYDVILIVIVFPIIGELVKSIGLILVKKELDEVEDGLIHGAIIGLSFGAFVNVAYLYVNFTWATEPVAGYAVPTLVFLIMSSISTMLLHGSSTAAAGYSVSEALVNLDYSHLVLYFTAGVLIHAAFNLLSIGTIYFKLESGLYALIGLGGVMLISMIVFRTIRARLLNLIRILDYETYKSTKRSR